MRLKRKTLIYIFSVLVLAFVVVACNDSGGDSEEIQVSMSMPLLNDAFEHGKGTGWGRADCLTCHPASELPGRHPALVPLDGATEEEVCMSCHLGNGADNRFKIPQCIRCHSSSAFVNPINPSGFTAHTVTRSIQYTMTDLDCIVCHDSTNMNGSINIDDFSQFGAAPYTEIKDFCFTCHSDTGVIAQGIRIKGTDIKSAYPDDIHGGQTSHYSNIHLRPDNAVDTEISCSSCHKQHTSSNYRLFVESGEEVGVVTDPAVLSKGITLNKRFSDDLRDLCVICHGETAGVAAPNGLNQVMHDNACTLCHLSGSFGYELNQSMMWDGRACITCHYHGANQGPNDTSFPQGSIHSRF